MALHYKRDGTLDMRYTSSREAVASRSYSYSTAGGGSNNYYRDTHAAPSYSGRASYAPAPQQLHYKKDGTLDMRYSSSREAVASSGVYASARGEALHYKKDGTLDMRYSSSREAVASTSGYYHEAPQAVHVTPSSSAGSAAAPHYKKDGTLDMRYSSSRAAAATTAPSPPAAATTPPPPPPPPAPSSSSRPPFSSSKKAKSPAASAASADVHLKKDGTLDMRYKSSQTAAATPVESTSTSERVHRKKDGSLDMRYKSSQEIAKRLEKLDMSSSSSREAKDKDKAAEKKQQRQGMGVPSYVPVTSTGRPDLRTKAAKDWITLQAQEWNDASPLPPWIPRLKDGSPDTTTSLTRNFFSNATPPPEPRRDDYYAQRLVNRMYQRLIQMERAQQVPRIQEPERLPDTDAMRTALDKMHHEPATPPQAGNEQATTATAAVAAGFDTDALPSDVQQLEYARDLVVDNSVAPLGHGSFGVVIRGSWNGKEVAIKKLHTSQLTKRDRKAFIKETLVLGVLGSHPNIVQLYGYTLTPVAIVMEFMPRGSLSFLLHYCEDPQVEAKMTDGRVKLNLLLGIAFGMAQLHACGVTHGDLKPQNVLVSDDYQAKIADFGLATFRAKTSSTTSSHVLASASSIASRVTNSDGTIAAAAPVDDVDLEGAACGTAAYMAPELLSMRAMASEKTDVYSFGILMNELLQEEEPFYQSLRLFVGKGPYAAAFAAQAGQRPVVHDARVTPQLKTLIEQCWSARAADRPTFEQVGKALEACSGVPNTCG
ncbi:putative serine/threonine-protein kinase [Globisporangium polare]